MERLPNFDRVARAYRWLEYVTLGQTLERSRFYFLPHLKTTGLGAHTHALVLGDGDGRFLARLLAEDAGLIADAVDTSDAMLTLLRKRCAFASSRVTTHQADAVAFVNKHTPAVPYDLVVTHFFLDCLTQPQTDALTMSIGPLLAPNALWLVSDFCIPAGPMRFPAWTLVRTLYLVFGLLTGLNTARLPDHAAALTRAGLFRVAQHHSLFGMLTTELWSNSSHLPKTDPLKSTYNHSVQDAQERCVSFLDGSQQGHPLARATKLIHDDIRSNPQA